MYATSSILIVATLLSFAVAAQLETVNIQLWPLAAASPQAFASISYNATHASIVGTPSTPSVDASESIVRVGYTDPSSKAWSGVATSANNFLTSKQRTILLHIDNENKLYHIGFRAVDKRKGAGSELLAEVVPMKPAPLIQMNKPVVLNPDGQLEGPQEKTFLQKYWWAIAGVLVLQVLLSGGTEEKK